MSGFSLRIPRRRPADTPPADEQPTTVTDAAPATPAPPAVSATHEEIALTTPGEIAASTPDLRERGRVRRRARYLRRLREIQLRDIGGLAVELHSHSRVRGDLIEQKVQAAARTTTELRALERALGDGRSLRELREAGIGGACAACGSVHGSADRFCSACGARLASTAEPGVRPAELAEAAR